MSSKDLKAAVTGHLDETRDQVEMLKQVFKAIGEKPAGENCDAIEGLIKECDGLLAEAEAEGVALDASVIGALQAIEHYEIARYGSLREWATALGHGQAADVLGRILNIAKAANAKLTGLAVEGINAPAK